MISNIQFEAIPKSPIKIDMSMQIDDKVLFDFQVKGTSDAGTLKKIVKILNREEQSKKSQ